MPLTYELNSVLSANEREIRSPPLLFLKNESEKAHEHTGWKGVEEESQARPPPQIRNNLKV